MIKSYQVRVIRGWQRGQKRGDIVTVQGEGNRTRVIRFGMAEAVEPEESEHSPLIDLAKEPPVKKKRTYRKKKTSGD